MEQFMVWMFTLTSAMTMASSLAWILIFVITLVFRVKVRLVHNKEDIVCITKKMNGFSQYVRDDNPCGLVFGKWYVGYISDTNNQYGENSVSLWILTSKAKFEYLTAQEITSKHKHVMSIYERKGNYMYLTYKCRDLCIDHFIPRLDQQAIINEFKRVYDADKNAVGIVSGGTGWGKTMIGLLIAKELNGTYCDSHNPTEPGDTLELLYHKASPSQDKPLVLMFDEVDVLLERIHQGFPAHKTIPVRVKDKRTWNQYFDKINMGMYPYMVVVMTMNSSLDDINKLDASYIRDNRVHPDLKFEVA